MSDHDTTTADGGLRAPAAASDETRYVLRTMTWSETIELGRAGVEAYVLDVPDPHADDILNAPCRVFVPVERPEPTGSSAVLDYAGEVIHLAFETADAPMGDAGQVELLEAFVTVATGMLAERQGGPAPSNDGLIDIHFRWSDRHGPCYDCSRPAAFLNSIGQRLCGVCAANHAAAGDTIRRIEELDT